MLYVLALGSPTYSLGPESYAAWTSTFQWKTIYDYEYLYSGPLFTHQLSHLFIDFRGIRDAFMESKGIDYFENTRRATYVQREYAIRNPLEFAMYGETCWGFTACDGPGWTVKCVKGIERRFFDYIARGAPFGPDDGTIAPWVVVASLPFAPEIVLPTIQNFNALDLGMTDSYGFKTSFNPTYEVEGSHCGWVSPCYFGIDQGPLVLMIENYRTGLLWSVTKRSSVPRRGTSPGRLPRRLVVSRSLAGPRAHPNEPSMPSTSTPTPTPIQTSARRRPWSRIVRITQPLFTSEIRWHAIAWLVALLALLLGVSGLNVVNSYVGRDFMTAITERNWANYKTMAIWYLLVFAASTAVAVFAKFCEERLGILWRGWLTSHLIDKYLKNRAYHRLMARNDIDNPDQRMTEDVKTFTTITLSFLLMLLNASITAIAFSRVIWLISPQLLAVAVGYAVAGSLLTVFVGRKLVELNNLQLKKEANFRYELIHVREYADSIALLRGEQKQQARLVRRLNELVNNFRSIVSVNRNLGFFTIGYNYLIQVIPIFIVAPRYIRGEVEFGVVTQSTMAFAQLLGAFSLIVTQFTQISSFAAVVNRLGTIWEALEEAPAPLGVKIEIIYDETRLAYEDLTLRSPKGDKVLIEDLNLEIPLGRRMLILGQDGIAKNSLGRATAGIWDSGEGRIIRPSPENILFVPQRPYTALGTLRDQFYEPDFSGRETDERLDLRPDPARLRPDPRPGRRPRRRA